jgi:hypothetical protein
MEAVLVCWKVEDMVERGVEVTGETTSSNFSAKSHCPSVILQKALTHVLYKEAK